MASMRAMRARETSSLSSQIGCRGPSAEKDGHGSRLDSKCEDRRVALDEISSASVVRSEAEVSAEMSDVATIVLRFYEWRVESYMMNVMEMSRYQHHGFLRMELGRVYRE